LFSQRSRTAAWQTVGGKFRARAHADVHWLLEIWRGAVMRKGYWITLYRSVSNPAALAAYAKAAGPAIAGGGGRFLVRGMPAKTYEAGLDQRCVVIEFESLEKAIAVYESPEYQAAKKLLEGGAERDVRMVEGV
jgi:uncharacterized protein (DUF1330 family)